MKRRIITLFVVSVFFTTLAFSQVTVGVKAGVNFQNINGKDDGGDKLENNLTIGYHAGVDVEIPVADPFYFQAGILYSTKGAKYKAEGLFAEDDDKISLSYVEVPLHFVFKPEIGGGKIILGVGPYIAYGIGGSGVLYGEDVDVEYTDNRELGNPNYTIKAFDAGGDIFFGYEFPFSLYFQINAQLGLLDLMPKVSGEESDAIIKNTGFGASIGYRFKVGSR